MVGVVGADAVGDGLAGFEEGVLGCVADGDAFFEGCLLYTSPSPRDRG